MLSLFMHGCGWAHEHNYYTSCTCHKVHTHSIKAAHVNSKISPGAHYNTWEFASFAEMVVMF